LLKRGALAVMAVGIVASTLAGCSETSTGSPSAGNTMQNPPTTSAGSSSTSGGDELSFEEYTSDPCSILTAEQATALGKFRDQVKESRPSGPGCTWEGDDVLDNSTYEIVLMTDGSTVDTVKESVAGVGVVEETTVEGLDAVSYDSTDATRGCTTVIGTSSDAAILVQISVAKNDTANSGKACGATERLATTVVQNLRG
jgi:hypothetical protein